MEVLKHNITHTNILYHNISKVPYPFRLFLQIFLKISALLQLSLLNKTAPDIQAEKISVSRPLGVRTLYAFAFSGNVVYSVAIPAAVCSIVGSWAGAKVAVGAAISIGVVKVDTHAISGREVVTSGNVTVGATSANEAMAEAKAGANGAKADDGEGDPAPAADGEEDSAATKSLNKVLDESIIPAYNELQTNVKVKQE